MALGWRGQYLRYKDYFLNILNVYKQKQDLRMFLEVVLSLVTISIFSIFALKPTALTIIELVKEIKGKEETLSLLTQKVQDLNTARNNYESIQSQIQLIESSVPQEPLPDGFTRQIEGIAAKNSVSVSSISVGEIALIGTTKIKKATGKLKPFPQGANEMSVSISVSGGYPNLSSFINDLENLRRPIKIDALQITSSETIGGKVIVAIVSGRTPYMKQ
ncbi:hypothetical protein ACFL1Q_02260 [Patescibacteria group bacterium]